jgi:hypothetical protein
MIACALAAGVVLAALGPVRVLEPTVVEAPASA